MEFVSEYIQFFEDFAKNHVDICHLDPATLPAVESYSTAAAAAPVRFSVISPEDIYSRIRGTIEARQKAHLYLELFDAGFKAKAANQPDNPHLHLKSAVTAVREASENDRISRQQAFDCCYCIIMDLASYLMELDCHPIFQFLNVNSLRIVPEHRLLDGNAFGWTLEFAFHKYKPAGVRLDKFKSGYLPASIYSLSSQISFDPLSGSEGDPVLIDLGSAVAATEVTGVRFGDVLQESFSVVSGNEISADVPAGAASGQIIIETAACAYASENTFTVA